MYRPKEGAEKVADDWEGNNAPADVTDSLEEEDEILFEDVFEPFCSTCGEQLVEKKDDDYGRS